MSSDKRHICLIGFSGSGKSTVGPILARKLKRSFVDIDSMVAKEYGSSIHSLFVIDGEPRFRELECEMIRRSVSPGSTPSIIALGGGAFEDRNNRTLLLKVSIVIWLSCSVREICRRLANCADRPLINVNPESGQTLKSARMKRIASLHARRIPSYQKAHIRVATTQRTPSQTTIEIIRRLRGMHVTH